MSTLKQKAQIIYDIFTKTSYVLHAQGFRNVNSDELWELCLILADLNKNSLNKVHNLYRYSPDTINLSKSYQKRNCQYYDEELCLCYHPDHKNECWYRESLEKNNQRQRNTAEYTEWGIKVFERDKYTCQKCSQVGGQLNAHHIKSYVKYPELRFVLKNGLTFCEKCHKEIHKRGRKNV